MITKYRLGKPIPTEAILQELPIETALPEFLREKGDVLYRCELEKNA